MPTGRRSFELGRHRGPRLAITVAAIAGLAALGLPAGADPGRLDGSVPALAEGDEAQLLRFAVAAGQVDQLAEQYDLAEYVAPLDDGRVEIHAVVNAAETSALESGGAELLGTLTDASDIDAAMAERATTLEAIESAHAEVAETGQEFTVLRSEWFESLDGGTYLSVEVKSALGDDASNVLTASWGTQSRTMNRFTDAGQYMYHRFNQPVPISEIPSEVTITSSAGNSITTPVTEWLGAPRKSDGPTYVSSFVDHYMDPTEVYDRMEALAAEFPDLAEIVELPYQTNGYRRHAQILVGTTPDERFYLTSHAWGHEGGNDLTLAVIDPGTPNAPLTVSVDGNDITVTLGTDGSGTPVTTAAQVVTEINATAEASALVTASTYRGNAGGAPAVPAARQNLSDFLSAPDHIAREPFTVRAIRIGETRDGSKTGVFAYSQEHAREWVTPLVAVETAERLLRNYQTDARTRTLVKDLDIFIIPSVNPDGAHYSMYDRAFQRRNMTNHCDAAFSDPLARGAWGVDVNRNFSVGSRLDGYDGASGSCVSDVYSGPSELSEPEARNEVWLTEQYPNIKFSMNVHSYGGYFMWAPGAYIEEGRIPLPRPTLAEESSFWAASSHILSTIQDWRGTAIWPGRTGPVIDVLYSAAGNSADEHWYGRGIYAWNFEVGADIYNSSTQRWQAVGFQPPFSEGYEEAMEFANGVIGMLEVAQAYQSDVRPPRSAANVESNGEGGFTVTFDVNESAAIYYETDGSAPTYASSVVVSAGMREGAAPIEFDGPTTLTWFSVDTAGNVENRYDAVNGSGAYRRLNIG
jgi:hypothetical protein